MRVDAGVPGPFYQRLAQAAARVPGALALQVGERCLTHGQWLALADATADRWQQQGLGPGQAIGWLGHNSPEMLAALLACARLGAVFVPLNWRLAPTELVAVARHAGLAVLLGTPELAALADQVRAGLAAAEPLPPQPLQPDDLMLVYTSGTTGEPKGAVHTHAGMLANIDMAIAVQGLGPADRVLAVLPLFHVGGLCIQVLPALAAGAAVRLQPRFEPAAWLNDVATWRPSTSLLVPAVMQALLAQPGWASADLSSLRHVNSGSQVVPLGLIEAFHARGLPVTQVYGSTETGPFSVALPPADALAWPGSVGRPAPGVRLRLAQVQADAQVQAQEPPAPATAQGRPAPPEPEPAPRAVGSGEVEAQGDEGEVGEIHLQAPNLMRGYHRLPQGTGFVQGWFATGDLARLDAHGRLWVVGRSKDLIISGGENIHPAEIENLAATFAGVAEAAVVALPDARWGEVPVLALVAQPGQVIDLDRLRELLAERLARFKQPRQVLELPALPRTALGKVQKARLAELVDLAVRPPGERGPSGG